MPSALKVKVTIERERMIARQSMQQFAEIAAF
jgi:hypothetical protein